MGAPAAIPRERIAEFTRDWVDDVKVSVMAEKYGCSAATITATASRLQLPPRRTGTRRPSPRGDGLIGGRWVRDHRGIQVYKRWGVA